jgi:hypothetical protein
MRHDLEIPNAPGLAVAPLASVAETLSLWAGSVCGGLPGLWSPEFGHGVFPMTVCLRQGRFL